MTSIIKVDNIHNSSGAAAMSIDSGGRTSFPNTAGLILQVVEDSTTTAESTTETNSSSQTTTALSLNITPTSASSKILLLVNLQTYNNSSGGSTYYNLFKDGTRLTTAGNGIRHWVAGGTGVASGSMTYLDSPATTNQITYDIRYYVSGGSGYLSVNQGPSSIIAMEISV